MANVNKDEVVKKESKIKKFFTSKGLKTGVQIGTTILTVLNTIFLVWTCASTVEAEVNADVIDEYNEMKGVETEAAPAQAE